MKLALVGVLALVAATCAPALADIGNLQTTAALTATGSASVTNLYGQTTCATTLPATGTPVGTVTFEGSADNGTTWTALQTSSIAGGAQVTTTTSTGLYLSNVSGLTGFRARVSAYTSGTFNLTVTCTNAVSYGPNAVQPISGTVTSTPSGTQAVSQSGTWTVQPGNTPNTTSWLHAFCNTGASPSCVALTSAPSSTFAVPTALAAGGATAPVACSKSAVVSVTGVSNTQIIAASGSTVIYICGFAVVASGTTPQFQWFYGTGVNCATGPVSISGIYSPTSGNSVTYGSGLGTIFRTTASQAFCMSTAGGSPTITGTISYDQF